MARILAYSAMVVALFGAGCDRPFIAIEPPTIEVIGPDLSEVQPVAKITLHIRVSSLRPVTRIDVNGVEASPTAEPGIVELDLILSEGVNTLFVEAVDSNGDAGSTTLFAVHLPYGTANIASATLPKRLANHTATRLLDGSVFVAGGFSLGSEASASAYTFVEQGFDFMISQSATTLSEARAGHTATSLPDGRVLLVGGSTDLDPGSGGDFVTFGELYDPESDEFSTPAFSGEVVRRAFHSATALSDQGRTFVYLFGGRGIVSGSAVGTRSDITVLELRSTAVGDSLINLSPGGAIGAFPPVARHIQLPLPNEGDFVRTFVAGTYEPPDGAGITPVSFRFRYTPSTFFFPFEVLEGPLPSLQVLRSGHAGALVAPGLAIIAGGRSPDGAVLNDIEVFSDEAGQFFRFPASVVLRNARHAHTATLLPSGRILLLGGVNSTGTILDSAEYILPSPL